MEERALGEVETVDTPTNITPQDFSFEDFLNGVRPTRRSVRLYPRADLMARLDEITILVENADEDENMDDLIDEFDQVKAEFLRTGVWFTVEKRSSEWLEEFRTATEKRLGYARRKTSDDAEPTLTDRQAATISVHQLAEQIVVPSAVTVDHLHKLLKLNEGEYNKLVFAMYKVNGELAENSTGADRTGVLTKDFSRRRSGSQ